MGPSDSRVSVEGLDHTRPVPQLKPAQILGSLDRSPEVSRVLERQSAKLYRARARSLDECTSAFPPLMTVVLNFEGPYLPLLVNGPDSAVPLNGSPVPSPYMPQPPSGPEWSRPCFHLGPSSPIFVSLILTFIPPFEWVPFVRSDSPSMIAGCRSPPLVSIIVRFHFWWLWFHRFH